MELERVTVLECTHPQALTLRNTRTNNVFNCAIFNCSPIAGTTEWPPEAVKILRFWLSREDSQVWFVRMDQAGGMIFFEDYEDRIINAKKMLCELQLAKNTAFVFKKLEETKLSKLKEVWVDLHDLTIDYNIFRNLSPKRSQKLEDADTPEAKKAREEAEDLRALKAVLEEKSSPKIKEEQNRQIKDYEVPQKPEFDESSFKFHRNSEYSLFVYGKNHTEPYPSRSSIPYFQSMANCLPR